MATKKPTPPAQVETELYQLIVQIYSRWTGQQVADAVARYRKELEAQQEIELLKTQIESLSKELEDKSAK
jgi:hypothetical protein